MNDQKNPHTDMHVLHFVNHCAYKWGKHTNMQNIKTNTHKVGKHRYSHVFCYVVLQVFLYSQPNRFCTELSHLSVCHPLE